MAKSIIISICLLLFVSLSYSQDTTKVETPPAEEKKAETPKQPLASKIYYGGNFTMSFGSYTVIGIHPLVGYKITPKLSAGVKVGYEYVSDTRYATDYSTSNYGGSVFSRFRVINPIYLHAEYAGINYELYDMYGASKREWVPFLYLGGGYSKQLGGRSWLIVQVLFDVLQSSNSPYASGQPFWSVGVGVGF